MTGLKKTAERWGMKTVGARVVDGAPVFDLDTRKRPDVVTWLATPAERRPAAEAQWAPSDPGGFLACYFLKASGDKARFWIRLAPGIDLRRIVAEGHVGFSLPGGRPVFVPMQDITAAVAALKGDESDVGLAS